MPDRSLPLPFLPAPEASAAGSGAPGGRPAALPFWCVDRWPLNRSGGSYLLADANGTTGAWRASPNDRWHKWFRTYEAAQKKADALNGAGAPKRGQAVRAPGARKGNKTA